MKNLFCGEGNLGNQPTLKYVPLKQTGEQKAVLELDVRFNYEKLNQQTGEFEDAGGFWAKVSIWGRRAELFNHHLVKGCRVLIVGEMRQVPYIATKGQYEGQERVATEIAAEHIAIVPLGIDQINWTSKPDRQAIEDTHSLDDEIPM